MGPCEFLNVLGLGLDGGCRGVWVVVVVGCLPHEWIPQLSINAIGRSDSGGPMLREESNRGHRGVLEQQMAETVPPMSESRSASVILGQFPCNFGPTWGQPKPNKHGILKCLQNGSFWGAILEHSEGHLAPS